MRNETREMRQATDYLRRARLALRVLSRTGLGDLDWLGPNWICAFGDIDDAALRFLLARLRQDTRLRRTVRDCRRGRELRRAQEAAIGRALREYATITGRPAAPLPEAMLEQTPGSASPAHPPHPPQASWRGVDA